MDDYSPTALWCDLRPRSFAGLMALYESNWHRLHALVPALARLRGVHVSRVYSDCDVHLAVIERSRYTTTLRLTYVFDDEQEGAGARPLRDPDIVVRVYHDARQVEAMRCAREHRHAVLRRIAASHAELDRRWARNVLLGKWLEYLLDSGHLFTGLPSQGASLAPGIGR